MEENQYYLYEGGIYRDGEAYPTPTPTQEDSKLVKKITED